jgi:glycosyltransferase involved in cell wall biosynthesis
MKPLVSILIPAYNAQKWIADSIQSARDQTWPNKEIIVVDDGSRDRTLPIARQFTSKVISVVTQENQGAAAARNRALELCQGDYIQWLDADDVLAPDKIERQMEVAERCQSKLTLLSSAWGYFFYRRSRATFTPSPLWNDLSPVEWLTRKWEGNWHMQTATWLVSRKLTDTAGPWDTRLLGDDDGEYFARVINASDAIQFIPQSRVYYRITSSARLSYIGRSDKKMEAQFLGMKLQIGYLRAKEDSERTRSACVTHLQTWLLHFYPNRPDLMHEAQQVAASLGGQLSLPKASWKYAWIERLFGFAAAKDAQLYYNEAKSYVLSICDKIMYLFERRRSAPN